MNKIDFGYEEVGLKKKVNKVKEVFDNVAIKYDIMNDIMSFGIHRLWKKRLIPYFEINNSKIILDLAGGTGDITKLICENIKDYFVVLGDINYNMISVSRKNMINKYFNVFYIQMNGEKMPFSNCVFDCVVISFGIRNFSNKKLVLKNIYNILKVGGKLIILEFSKPTNKYFKYFYDFYSFKLLPKFGMVISNSENDYKYLVQSIRLFTNKEELSRLILSAGFINIQCVSFTYGIVCMHIAYKN